MVAGWSEQFVGSLLLNADFVSNAEFMAPETIRAIQGCPFPNEPAVSPAADVFSLGSLLKALLLVRAPIQTRLQLALHAGFLLHSLVTRAPVLGVPKAAVRTQSCVCTHFCTRQSHPGFVKVLQGQIQVYVIIMPTLSPAAVLAQMVAYPLTAQQPSAEPLHTQPY